jgi:hypothetical protein
MLPAVALIYRVLGFSAQALEDREGLCCCQPYFSS